MNTSQQNKFVPITLAEVRNLAEIINTLGRAPDLSIVTPETEKLKADRDGLIQFLGNSLLSHAGEFVNSYMIAQSEYFPLVGALATVLQRVDAVVAHSRPAPAPFKPTIVPSSPEASN